MTNRHTNKTDHRIRWRGFSESRRILCGLLATLQLLLPSLAAALPSDGKVVGGNATILQTNPQTLNIQQATDKAILNWKSFSIAADEAVHFVQPSVNSIALNRVIGTDPSVILGRLQSNGRIFLLNPNGILFGAGAQVNVGGLFASTLQIRDEDFMAGRYLFTQDPLRELRSVINRGTIQVSDHGYVFLAAPGVSNEGLIVANLGTVVLASGQHATVDLMGDGLISYTLSGKVLDQVKGPDGKPLASAVSNSGTIQADGGHVILQAKAAGDIFSSVVNQSGVVRARSLVNQEGIVRLDGSDGGTVQVAGTIDASGVSTGQKGGRVSVLGESVVARETARIDVSGDLGGGTALIGGNYQGAGPEPNAKNTLVAAGASIAADAVTQGDGGRVIVWADGHTGFAGGISAKGGASGGNGGFVEVSGKNTLDFSGDVNTSAPMGQTGTLLLDPTDITISSGANANIVGLPTGPTFTGSALTSTLNVTTLQNALAANNVTVDTTSGFASAGNITVSNAVTWASANSLTLRAHNNITVNAGISATGSGLLSLIANQDAIGGGNLALNAAISARLGGIQLSGAGITSLAASTIMTTGGANQNAGNITVTGTGAVNLAGAVTATGGTAGAGTPGRNGGTVTISGVGVTTGTVTANGSNGGGANQTGGNGGTIQITSTNGITTGALTTSGGNAGTGNAAGGAGGTISVTNNTAGNLTTGALTARTGNAIGTTASGAAGSISVTQNNTGGAAFLQTGAINTVGGFNGNGGSVNLSSQSGLQFGAASTIQTTGGAARAGTVGRNAGNVTVSGRTVTTTGAITASGSNGNGANQAGGNAGTVSITTNGALTTSAGAITASGGNAGTGNAAGGNGGTINLTNNSITTGNLTTGTLTARTGNAIGTGAAGTAGSVLVTQSNATGGATLQTGAIDSRGGNKGAGGAVTLNSASNVTVTSTIQTTGGAAIAGATHAGATGGNVTITGVNRSITGLITASGGAAVGTNQAGGNAGVVSITGTGTSTTTGGVTTSTGAATGTGAGGTAGSITLSGTTVGSGALTTTGGANGNGGNVVVDSSNGTVTLATVTTSGGTANANMAGRDAGTVGITSAGNITVSTITAAGSNANGGNLNGGNGSAITLDAAGGATTITHTSITTSGGNRSGSGTAGTGGNINVVDAALLSANTTLTATGGSAGLGAGGNVTFGSTVNGNVVGRTLAVNTNGQTTFTGVVGGTAALGSLTTDAAGTVRVGGNVTTTGVQTYNDPLTLLGSSVMTGTTPTFSTVAGGGFDLTLNFSGTTTINGANFTGINNFASGNGGTTNLTGALSTAGTQTYNDAVNLTGATTLTSSGNQAITFNSTLNGAQTLAVNTAGTTTFGGIVGGTTALTSLTTNAGGTTAINTTGITTTGAQTYNDAVTLGANAVLSAGAGNLTFGNTLDGAFSLTANSTGLTTFGGIVGGTTALTSLTTNAGGTTAINGGAVTTTGAQSYNDAVTLGANATLDSGAGNLTFANTLNGAFSLNANSTGTTTFGGVVGGTTALTSLTTNAGGTTAINTTGITTTGAQTYNDAVTLGVNAVLNAGAGTITFANSLNGAFALTANSTGLTTFGGAVGNGTALLSLATNAGGTTAINGGSVTTSGNQTYNDNVTMNQATTLTSTGGAVTFGGNATNTASGASITVDAPTINLTGGTTIATTGNGNINFFTDSLNPNGAAINAGTGAFSLAPNVLTRTIEFGDVNTGQPTDVYYGSNFGSVTAGSFTIGRPTHTGNIFVTGVAAAPAPISIVNGGTGSVTFQTNSYVSNNRDLGVVAGSGGISLGSNVTLGTGTLRLTTSGAITQTAGAVTATTAGLSAGTGISLAQPGNNVTTLAAQTTVGNLSFTETNGFAIGAVAATADGFHAAITGLTANGGSITLQSGGGVTQTQSVLASTLNLQGSGPFTLTNGSNDVTTLTANTTGNVQYTDVNALAFGASNVGGRLDVATGGTITQSGAVTVTGTTTLAAGAANNITLTDPLNNFSTVGITSGNNVALVDANALDLGASTVSGTLNVTTNGALTQSGAVTAAGVTTLAAGANDITLTDAGNNFSTVIVTNGNHVSLTDSNALTLGASTVSGNLALTTGGTLSQSGVLNVTGTTSFTATAANTDVVLDTQANNFGGPLSFGGTQGNVRDVQLRNVNAGATVPVLAGLTNLRNLTLTFDNAPITLPALNASGNLTLTAGGSINQSGPATVGGTTSLATTVAGSDFLFDQQANNLTGAVLFGGTLTNVRDIGLRNVNGSASIPSLAGVTNLRNLTLTFDNAPIALPAVTAAGNLNLTAGGSITQTGAATIGGTTTLATTVAGSDVLMGQANNLNGAATIGGTQVNVRDLNLRNVNAGATVPTLTGLTNLRNLTLTFDNASMTLPTLAASGNLAATAGGLISQSGALTVAGSANFNTTAAPTLGSVTLTNGGALTLNTSTVGGNLVATTVAGDMTLPATETLTVVGNAAFNPAGNLNLLGTTRIGGTQSSTGGGSSTFTLGADTNLNSLSLSSTGNITVNTTGTSATFAGGPILPQAITLNNASNNFGGPVSVTTAAPAFTGNNQNTYNLTQSAPVTLNAGQTLTVTDLGGTAGTRGNITLTNAANSFETVNFIGGNIAWAETGPVTIGTTGVSANTGTTSTGALSVTSNGGSISQTGAITAAGTTTLAAGTNDITLTNAANNFGTVGIISGNNVALSDVTALNLAASTVSGTLNVTTNGALTQTGALNVTGTATLAAGAANDITLTNAANDFATVAVTSGNNVALTDANALNLGASTVAGTLSVITNGALTQSGAVAVAGTTTLQAGAANDITLTNAGNNFSTVGITSGNNVAVTDTNALVLGTSTVSNNLTVTTGGTLTQSGPLTVAGLTTVATGANDITLNGANDFNTVAVTSGNNVAINDVNALDLGTSTVNGTLTVTTNGALTQSGALNVAGATTLATGAGNNITLANAGNNFSTVGITSGNNVVLTDVNALNLAASTVSGTLNVTAGGALTQSGALSVTGLTTLAAGANDITLTNAGNNFSTVGITSGNNVALTDSNALVLGASNVASNLNVNTNGALTQSGVLTVGGTTTVAASAGNDITLNGANNFSSIGVTSGNNVTLNDVDALTLNGSTVGGTYNASAGDLTVGGALGSTGGGLALTATNSVTQSANLTAAGVNSVTVTATGGALTMAPGATTSSGTGTVTYNAGTNVTLGSLSTGGGVNVSANGGSVLSAAGAGTNVTAGANSSLQAFNGVVGTQLAPVTVNVNPGTLSIRATTAIAGISGFLTGTVLPSNTLTLLNVPPGLVCFNTCPVPPSNNPFAGLGFGVIPSFNKESVIPPYLPESSASPLISVVSTYVPGTVVAEAETDVKSDDQSVAREIPPCFPASACKPGATLLTAPVSGVDDTVRAR